jgi:heme/copper-type cytochrome/quinol oxidase subunit 2
MGYHYRRPPRQSRNPRLEVALTAVVIAILLGVLFLFLFVYHDVPLRTS